MAEETKRIDEFSNELFEGIHYSRFIASYVKIKGKLRRKDFMSWMSQLKINGKEIPEEIIVRIYNFGTNGKLELEENCRRFFE